MEIPVTTILAEILYLMVATPISETMLAMATMLIQILFPTMQSTIITTIITTTVMAITAVITYLIILMVTIISTRALVLMSTATIHLAAVMDTAMETLDIMQIQMVHLFQIVLMILMGLKPSL